jgi:hypothetical protein
MTIDRRSCGHTEMGDWWISLAGQDVEDGTRNYMRESDFLFKNSSGANILCVSKDNSRCGIFTTNFMRSSGHPRRASQFFGPGSTSTES